MNSPNPTPPSLPPFPVDDQTLDLLAAALHGSPWEAGSGDLFALCRLFSELAGLDPDTFREGTGEPPYHPIDVIKALVAETRRLRVDATESFARGVVSGRTRAAADIWQALDADREHMSVADAQLVEWAAAVAEGLPGRRGGWVLMAIPEPARQPLSRVEQADDWDTRADVGNALLAAAGTGELWIDPAGDVVGGVVTIARVAVAALDLPGRDARVRAAVVEEILAALKPEIDWQHEHYGTGNDKTGMGRLIGMQDAYATVARHRTGPAEPVQDGQGETGGTPDLAAPRDALTDADFEEHRKAMAEARGPQPTDASTTQETL